MAIFKKKKKKKKKKDQDLWRSFPPFFSRIGHRKEKEERFPFWWMTSRRRSSGTCHMCREEKRRNQKKKKENKRSIRRPFKSSSTGKLKSQNENFSIEIERRNESPFTSNVVIYQASGGKLSSQWSTCMFNHLTTMRSRFRLRFVCVLAHPKRRETASR